MTDQPDRATLTAWEIISKGGQILLPFDAGDAPVRFSSRWQLADMIAKAIRDAQDPTD